MKSLLKMIGMYWGYYIFMMLLSFFYEVYVHNVKEPTDPNTLPFTIAAAVLALVTDVWWDREKRLKEEENNG